LYYKIRYGPEAHLALQELQAEATSDVLGLAYLGLITFRGSTVQDVLVEDAVRGAAMISIVRPWLSNHSDDGNVQHVLGNIYDLGIGVSVDCKLAFQYHLKSALAGNVGGQFTVAAFYDGHCNTPVEDVKSFQYRKLAADQGLAIAQYYTGFDYCYGIRTTVNKPACIRYVKLAASQGLREAQYTLSVYIVK
jgi:TPR repeat protein